MGTRSSPGSYERPNDHGKYCHLNTPGKLLPEKERQEDTAVTHPSVFTRHCGEQQGEHFLPAHAEWGKKARETNPCKRGK